jgi:hypothetical protein
VVLNGGGTWNQANSTNFVAHDKGYCTWAAQEFTGCF